MTDKKDYLCILPFVHLYAGPMGETKPCCIADPFRTDKNLNTYSIDEVFNSKEYIQLRLDMLNNKRNKICNVCYDAEDRGEISSRLERNNKNQFDMPNITNGIVSTDFQYIDIRFSNKCNFKCRTCCHEFSSSWYEAEKQLVERKSIDHGTTNLDKKILKIENNFIENIKLHLNNLKMVYFAGGEPLIMPEQYEILEYICKSKRSVHIHYNTNLSTLKYDEESLIKMWKEIIVNKGSVYLAVSCDGLYDLGEYIRVGFKHKNFINNINQLKKNNISYGIQTTITTFNIYKVFETIEQMKELKIIESTDDITFFYARGPIGVTVKNLSKAHKEEVMKLYDENLDNVTKKTKLELTNMLKFMGIDEGDYDAVTEYEKEVKEVFGVPK